MAIIQTQIVDKIEILSPYKQIQVRLATLTQDEGVEVAPRAFHRYVIEPGTDMDSSDY